VFVTLGGYTRRWVPPGAVGDANAQIGVGHVFRSTDGGDSFVDVTGNLPDVPATWVELRGDQLLVGTDVGAFASQTGGAYATAATFAPFKDLPAVPVSSIVLKPGDPNTAVVAAFGRGVWTYGFDTKLPVPVETPPTPTPTVGQKYASYDFEADAQGWTTTGTPAWQRGSPGHGTDKADAPSGSAFAVAGNVGYLDNMDTSVAAPSVMTEAGPALMEWWMRLDTEGGYDTVAAEWSRNGTDWTTLATYSGKNDAHPGWSRYAVPFESPGGNVQVRFHFISDSLCSGVGGPICSSTSGWDGVHVDDVVLGKPAP
jgi:hypothetical protein